MQPKIVRLSKTQSWQSNFISKASIFSNSTLLLGIVRYSESIARYCRVSPEIDPSRGHQYYLQLLLKRNLK
jgi:hypothetical protein